MSPHDSKKSCRVLQRPILLLGAICLPVAIAVLAGLPVPAQATPYWSPEEVQRWEAAGGQQQSAAGQAVVMPPSQARPDYLEMFGRIAAFEDLMQVSTPGDPNFGGIREAEHMMDIIETDNTSEAIWVWTRYYELTGDDRYYQNILDAYTYCLNFPAYDEGNDHTPQYGYYAMYNCGWAVRAEQKYRDIYGDDTYKAYADSCASYLRYHTLTRPGTGFYSYVNPPVLAWAMGNLYYVGTRQGNEAWRAEAVRQADEYIKTWTEAEPTLLGRETWAMSGGTMMWGLLNSYFLAHRDEIAIWVPAFDSYMDTWSSPGQFQNAWNAWYALGHEAVADALDDSYHAGLHLAITDFLVAEDADVDGGIPGRPEDTDAMDQAWVTNYLAYMGCDPLLPAASGVTPSSAPLAILTFRAGPNPATSALEFNYELGESGPFALQIVDASGRDIATLGSADESAGLHALTWSGRDGQGRAVPSGTYFAVMRAGAQRVSRPIIWLR